MHLFYAYRLFSYYFNFLTVFLFLKKVTARNIEEDAPFFVDAMGRYNVFMSVL